MPETRPLLLSDLRPGTQFRQYRLLEQIGAGGQGVVWSAQDQAEQRIVAIKLNEVPNSDQKRAEDQIFERQAGSLVRLRHPNILPMYDYGMLEILRYMVTPYIPGESLEERLNGEPLSVEQTLQFSAQIAGALNYLHAQQVVHRDLKPANILMDFSQNLYVADFGLARILSFSTQAMHTGRGTPPYASPEQHSMSEITLQSDLYSFGVMLYEMFARELPWRGEKILGIQQLNSDAEIPDPAQVDPGLPADLVLVLRRLTAFNPARRPASAGEAMQAIYDVFQRSPIRLDGGDEKTRQNGNADLILRNGLARWKPDHGTVVLSLTKFAYVELREKQTAGQTAAGTARDFILQNALAFGYDDDFWWTKITDPKERLAIAGRLLNGDNQAVAARVIGHLVNDDEIRKLKFRLPEGILQQLLQLAAGTGDLALREAIIRFLRLFTPMARGWRAKGLEGNQDVLLARLALEESELGNEAARLIGQRRSVIAIETVLKTADEDRRREILLQVQKTAGWLPGSISLNIRLQTFVEWVAHRLTAELPGLPWAAVLTFIGAMLGAGLQVYLTYRLPNFMDLERISISVQRGIFLGAGIGLAILLSKVMAESFPEMKPIWRLVPAWITGGLVLGASFFIYDTLFLQTIPEGLLMPLGCLLWAGGYAAAGLAAPRPLKMAISYLACVTALGAAWFAHAALAAAPTLFTPLFFYEYGWSPAQVLQTLLVVALPMAVLPHLVRLTPKDE